MSVPVDEAWRASLAVGDAVAVRSASAGMWLQGRVVAVGRDRVKVEYVIGSERCDKTMLRSSPALAQGSGVTLPPAWAGPPREATGETATVVPAAQRQWVEAAPPLSPSPMQPAQRDRSTSHCLSSWTGEWLRVADLQIGELLGSGGFGSVHRGRIRGGGEEVAIKRLHFVDGQQISSDQLMEFHKEVVNLQALRHPRLINLIGVALEPPVLCIVTELAPGGSLHSLLHVQHVHLSEARRRILAVQVAEGVAFLHGRRPPLVHRDLKSANVVLDADMNAKLCDFGLTESMEKTHLSRRDSEGGSPRYMAPEVFDARCKLTEKLDVWALGCLVVEVITSRVPHEDCTTIQQVAAKLLVRQEKPFEDSWGDGVRPDVRRLVAQCFQRDPSTRSTSQGLFEGLSVLEGFFI